MAHTVKRIARGSSTKVNSYAGPAGELVMDTTTNDLVLETGVQGGVRMAKASTAIAATNGVSVTAGGTLGEATTISGVDASTTAKGVVQLESAVTGTAGIVPDSAAVKAYADSAGAPYTATTPIEIDATNRVISADDATTTAKGVVQVGTNIDVASGTISVKTATTTDKGVVSVGDNVTVNAGAISVKPWATYEADHTDVVLADIQDGCIVQTDEPIGGSTLAVLAEVEQDTLSGSPVKVPTSAVVKGALYELCEFYYFRHPTLRPGFVQAAGGLIANANTLYPKAWAYLQTAEGQLLCKTEAEWQAMSTAIYYTDASGNQEGWNGVGGVPFFVIDTSAGTIRVPDIRGMYAEAAGLDSLAVGGVHHDRIRNVVSALSVQDAYWMGNWGAFIKNSYRGNTSSTGGQVTNVNTIMDYDQSRVYPTGNHFVPRAWGALPCVFLGA